MIALAIESSNSRGMGHLFRSLLMVEYFKKHNLDFVYLINNDEKSIEILKQKKIEYVLVDYEDTCSNWEKSIIEKYGITIWINDKYYTSIEMSYHIKSTGIFLALIDDIGPGEEFSNVNFVGLVFFSKKEYKSQNTRIGTKYVILNKEIDQNKRLRKTIKRIIVTFGGSDPFNNTKKVVEELLKYNYLFDVVTGPNYLFFDDLNKLNDQRFNIYRQVPSLIAFFKEYDFAITGGGVTCCEAIASGLPCAIIANAPHEINTGRYLESLGCSLFAGDYKKVDFSFLDNIESLNCEEMSKKGMDVFDTSAIDRIINEINELTEM